MKVLILAGGFGTRLAEETHIRPKPMAEIGGMPIIWHIMKIYSKYGYNDFIICLGYKGYYIKEYFANYYLHQSNVTFDMGNNNMQIHSSNAEPWKVTLVDTGLNTMTGGRVKRVAPFLDNKPFMLTYGDGVIDANIQDIVKFHEKNSKKLTVTSVQPSGRFGALNLSKNNQVNSFLEKPKGDGAWINGGFFVCQPEVLDYISNDKTVFEREPLENLAADGEMMAYKHNGFWQPMDTLRDKEGLEKHWEAGTAPWKIWK